MAQKRMLDKSFLSQKQFLTLPSSAKILYVYGNTFADNDGFVEIFPLVAMVNASEDDVKILEAKGFVVVLNEDWVCFLPHWWDNQAISFNRYNPSRYRNLLWNERSDLGFKLQKVQDTKLERVQQSVQLSYLGERTDVDIETTEDCRDSVATLSVPIESKRIELNRTEKKDSLIHDEIMDNLFSNYEKSFGKLSSWDKTQLRDWCDKYSVSGIIKTLEKTIDYNADNPMGYMRAIVDSLDKSKKLSDFR